MKRFPIPMIVCALPLFVGCISDRTSPRTYYHEPTDEDRAYAKRLEGDIKSTEREIRYYSEGFAAKNREKIEAKTKERDELRIQINEEDDRDTRKKFELEARVLLEEINMLKKSTENFQAMASQRILPPAKRSRQEMMQKREEVLGLSPIRVTYCEVHGEKMFKGYVGRRGAPIMPLSYSTGHTTTILRRVSRIRMNEFPKEEYTSLVNRAVSGNGSVRSVLRKGLITWSNSKRNRRVRNEWLQLKRGKESHGLYEA